MKNPHLISMMMIQMKMKKNNKIYKKMKKKAVRFQKSNQLMNNLISQMVKKIRHLKRFKGRKEKEIKEKRRNKK